MLSWKAAILFAAVALFVTSIQAQTTASVDLNKSATTLLDLDIDGTTLSTATGKPGKNCSDNQVFVDLKCIDKTLKDSNSSLIQFFLVAVLSGLYVIYMTFFNSRLLGFILTKILNQFVKDGYLKFGSFSFSVLSGKIMFRDVQYITPDSSIFIYDGYCIFRWWRPYKFSPWRKKRDLNEGHTRLSFVISGLEYHVYNRSDVYGKLEELFGLDSEIFTMKSKAAKQSPKKSDTNESRTQKISWWRNLIPVIKLSVSYGKVIFGNRLLPSTLVVAYEDANAQYKTTTASNKYDLFMHVLEGTLGSVRFMLVPSSKYDPTVLPEDRQSAGNDPAPRTMSEGYDLVNSNHVNFKYMWDEPGKTGIPLAQSIFSEHEVKTGDTELDDDNTLWELEVRCKRRMLLNYGPWADRQINLLWRFYYPLDYQKQQVTPVLKRGEIRAPTSFNMYLNLLHESDIDLLFLKNDEPSAIHIHLQKGSCVEMHVPMTVAEDGFTTHVSGQLIYPNASTSMSYRPLISAEMLSFNITANYPLMWNAQQMWICDIKASKVSASLVFEHKNFIADLMDDWSSRDPPDLLTFAPYKMKFNFDLQDFELLLPANEYNWIDCATKRKENALVGLTGRSLKIDFTLPFHSFLAQTYSIPFSFHIVRGELCLFLPQSNPTRNLLLNLSNGMEEWSTDKPENILPTKDNGKGNSSARSSAEVGDAVKSNEHYYKNSHQLSKDPAWGSINADWVKCWDAPEMELLISYMWHPVVPTRKEEQHKRSRDSDLNKEIEKVDKILQKINRNSKKASFKKAATSDSASDLADSTPLLTETGEHVHTQTTKSKSSASVMFDPTSLDPDEIRVDFTLKPGSTLYLYGSLLHHFIAVKENYLGVDDTFTDFSRKPSHAEPEMPEQNSNPLYYRTLQVTVNVSLHNVRGVLPVHANPAYKSCPTVRLKRLTFEMDKNYHQTRLQLLLSKLAIGVEENRLIDFDLFENEEIGRKGWLMLTDLQLRGHAMFSGAGLPLGSVTIEYGWLTEVLVGPVLGSLTVLQIQLLAQWLQTFVFLFKNSLHEMNPAYPDRYLPTGINWTDKKMNGKPIAEGDVKFLMLQVKLESVKLRVQEKDSALDLSISPILISNGNIQFPGVIEAASIRVQEVWAKHRIKKSSGNRSDADTAIEDVSWIEAGEVRFGSIHAMITVATPEREMSARQTRFLRFHDKKTRRLQFLWQDPVHEEPDSSGNSALISVQSLKSWGCNFFTPLTSKHPTYFYKSRKTPPRKQMSMHDGRRMMMADDSGDSSSSTSSNESLSDRDSDVFDPGMDYGMSLLRGGECLLSRSRTISLLSKKSTTSVDSAPRNADEESSKDPGGKTGKPAGEILTSVVTEDVAGAKPLESNAPRPSLQRQGKITMSTGNINNRSSLVALKSSDDTSPSLKKASAFRKPRSATVRVQSSNQHAQQVSFAPSPKKLSVLKRSSSQADVDKFGAESPKPAIKRALSSESNLYRSAESDFKSTTSLSSSEFYSAESDMDESKRSSFAEDLSPRLTMDVPPKPALKKESVARPGTLILDNGNTQTISTFSTSASNEAQPSSALSPTKVSSLSPGSSKSAEASSMAELRRSKSLSPTATLPRQRDTVIACYESHLTLLRLQPNEPKSEKILEAEDDDGWFDEDSYVLPGFAIVRDGIHPSVMVDRHSPDQIDHHQHHHHQHHTIEKTNRELSFEDMDSSGKSTSVSVHMRESLDVQLTPFLLSTISNIMDAAAPVIKHENPLSVVSQLEMDCINDATECLPEDVENEKQNAEKQGKLKNGEKPEKARPSLKRQKKVDASLDTENKTKVSPSHTVTRPPPGTKLSVKIDKVRLNVLQATLGDDKIFSLRCSKLLPSPCVTILSTRLDSLHVYVDMNSRRKNRLLMESLRRSSSATSDKKHSTGDPPTSKQHASTSSDLVTHKHFLVLLNAKATARSAGLQMRALTCDGSVPEMTSITALADKDCKAPFHFDPDAASTTSKQTVEKWIGGSGTPEPSSSSSKRKISRYYTCGPPKIWGWVMLEAGVDRVRLNVIKQMPVEGTRDIASIMSIESASELVGKEETAEMDNMDEAANDATAFEESLHVHFMEESLKSSNSSPGTDKDWGVQDTSLHASQGELFVGSVWLNLPSPSTGSLATGRALRTWNLLSCVSASITCWLDPGDRLATSFTNLMEETLIRHCAVTACILTEAFDQLILGKDGPEKPMEPISIKYDVLTAKAKLLRKDPNFLLCHEMQRFLSTPEGRQIVFTAVGPADVRQKHVPDLPALSTLKKGVSALIRQWTSQYSGVISSAKLKDAKRETLNRNDELVSGYEVNDGRETSDVPKTETPERNSLVLEIEPPQLAVEFRQTASTSVQADAAPRRQSRPVLGKSDTLSAIEEVVSSGSATDADRGPSVTDGASRTVTESTSKQPNPIPTKPAHMSPTEALVYEQQKSMYSWMSNVTKAGSPSKGSESAPTGDIEAQNLIQNEVCGVEETDFNPVFAPPGAPPDSARTTPREQEKAMDITNFEEVFHIFLHNVGIDINAPAPSKTRNNVSFIRGECLGSLALTAKLKLLKVDKQEADPQYNLDGQGRKKRKSSKIRKPRAYYSSLEHARELREPYVLNTSTWPHVYSQQAGIIKSLPILMCQEVEVKSSVIETDVEMKESKKDPNATEQTLKLEKALQSHFSKNRTTLKVGGELSIEHIVQHVDIALIRLVHQISQISDDVMQAKTDIQVNKYTEGSVSPDFKVLHRRTISNISNGSGNSVGLPLPKRQHSQTSQSNVGSEADGEDHVEEIDAMSHDSASTASTEVPHCWQVMYKMVNLYDSVPENKTEMVKKPLDAMHLEHEGSVDRSERSGTFSLPPQDPYLALVLKATAGVKKIEMHAAFGDLKLNAEIVDILTKVNHSKEALNAYKHKASSKFNTTLHGVNIKLVDQAGRPQSKTIATASIKHSSLDACTNHERESSDNIADLHLGLISFDLSQHPASLHDVVSRGSRQLSAHISEFAQTPTIKQSYPFDHTDAGTPYVPGTPAPSTALPPMTPMTPSALTTIIDLSQDSSSAVTTAPVHAQFKLDSAGISIVASLLPSLHAEYRTGSLTGEGTTGLDAIFNFCLENHMLQFTTTNTGYDLNVEREATTIIHLPEIDIDGEYKQGENDGAKQTVEKWRNENFSNQSSEGTSSELQLRSGDYLSIGVKIGSFEHLLTTDLLNQLIFLQEVFLKEINEMIDKVSKTSKPVPLWSETSLRSEESSVTSKPMLYQLKLTLKGIQITAATPSCNAVRLKTGEMMFELSNRVIQDKGNKKKNKKKKQGIDVPKYLKLFGKAQVDLTLSLGTLVRNSVYPEAEDEFQQLAYFTTRIGLQNTRQGTDDQARTCASATTFSSSTTSTMEDTSLFNNTSSHSVDDRLLNPQTSATGEESENSVVLISLTRPLFFIQPTAFDKAILVYLSYKNAYEDWKDQQKTVLKAARQVRDVLQSVRSRPSSATSLPRPTQQQQRTSTVFLQLSVDDMGICLPVTQTVQLHEVTEKDELPSALVLTIDNMLISAYYSRSLFTKGQMKGFCLRFADDFQMSLDDWRHTSNGSMGDMLGTSPNVIMNACVVQEGTYEICSDTTTYNLQSGVPPVAKTTVNVLWRMKGMDVHFDTKIGSYFSCLTDTLMAITGNDEQTYEEELDIGQSYHSDVENLEKTGGDQVDGGAFLSPKKSRSATVASTTSSHAVPLEVHQERTRKIEHELNEQVKVVNDLRQLGAKKSLVEEEEKRMHELESALSSNFRRIFKSRLRRSSLKTGSRKESSTRRFKPSHQRAKSAVSGATSTEITPAASKSAYSTMPYRIQVDDWSHPVRESYSATSVPYSRPSAASNFSTSPRHHSPLTYESDHVFPPTPDKNYGRLGHHSDETDDDGSSLDEDEVDGEQHPSSLNQPVRRSLYPEQYDPGTNPSGSKSESNLVNMSQMTSVGPEAELQLELEVKAEVDGGRIECHPYLQEIDVPSRPDHYGMKPPTYSASKTRSFVKNTTIFYIPGLDVKVQYHSATSGSAPNTSETKETKEKAFSFSPKEMEAVAEQNEASNETPEYITPPPTVSGLAPPNQPRVDPPTSAQSASAPIPNIEITTPSHFGANSENIFIMPESKIKTSPPSMEPRRACIHAWLHLQSLPEMVVSPYLLDFLEQTLNELANSEMPAQTFSQKHSASSSRRGSFHGSFPYSDDDASDIDQSEHIEKPAGDGSVLSSESPLVSLPLDVVVAVNVQPSQVRFNCVPMSRVECLLQIPSIDLAFSSIQDDIDGPQFPNTDAEEGTDRKSRSDSESKPDQASEFSSTANQSQKGLSFSAVLSDFSVYVFHPYGGKQPAGGSFPLDMTGSFIGSPAAGTTDSPFAKSGSGRRDSLNVNLEFVKITLVRKRKGDIVLVADFLSPGSSKGRVDNVIVHVNGLLDIGKASFKYDMRRLNEILAFPRAWYRRSIARRLFLGDTSEQKQSTSPHPNRKDTKRARSNTRNATSYSRPYAHSAPVDSSILSFLTVDSPLSPPQTSASRTSNLGRKLPNVPEDDLSSNATPGTKWKALVVLEMNMSRLDVEMNMSNVMGNTVWSCDALHSTGKLMFNSNGDRDINLTCGLDNSQIYARGGIIGGHIELKKFDSDCRMFDPVDGDPLHKLGMRAESLDGKIEYMGGCVMMGQLTQVNFQLKDEWRDPVQSIPSSMDKGTVYVHCDLGWRVFQLAISRSTTPDVIKMLSKLEEFFSQQFHSSVRAISSWTQNHNRTATPKAAKEPLAKQISQDAAAQYNHRRHWPPVYKAIASAMAESEYFSSQKQSNSSLLLGGSACLHGEALIVICFHGANFRSRSWVLFNILQPNIVHSSEVQEIKETVSGDETSTLAIQSLTVNLGNDMWLSRTQRSADPMATVSRVTRSRNQNSPPGSAAIAEWFAYMTASHNEELKMLRTLNDLSATNAGNASNTNRTASPQLRRQVDSLGNMAYSHEADIIFALPKVQLDFKTEHIQGPTEPDPNDSENRPVVECSFVTEFTDHICVTMDVELLLFLHDLISSYLKEKQQALSSRTKLSSLNVSIWNETMDTAEPSVPKPLAIDPIDLREFVCKTWQLEPTVTLISWAGRRIEPVGVDYILQKLGFQHARTTIPKWFQRGVLDLLDKGLAATVEKLVVAIIKEQRNR